VLKRPPVIEGQYLRDLLEQPSALDNTLETLSTSKKLRNIASRLNRGEFKRVVLTGMGSSFHALHPLHLGLIRSGVTAMMAETSELVHYGDRLLDSPTLVVAVSQSGQSAEVVELLRVMGTSRRRAVLVGVTNTEDSPLAKHSSAVLLTRAGTEFSVSCKTYVSTLMALKWLGDALFQREERQTRRELKHAGTATAAYLNEWENHVLLLVRQFKRTVQLFLVGRGHSLAAVGTGALIIKESDHYHAEGMSSAAFRHGPFEMLGKQTFVLVFSGDAKTRNLNLRLADHIRQQGAYAEVVGEESSASCFQLPKHHAALRPILEILPVHMITLALAAIAGREAGKFERATKITITE
jgi:glutamine---fructose-6-phosphate transaminase (isomerizing)